MTKEEIIEMAKQSGCHVRNGHIYNQYIGSLDQVLKQFAKLIAEKATAELRSDVKINQKNLLQKLTRGKE